MRVILIYNIKRVQHGEIHKDPKLEPYFVSFFQPMNFHYTTNFQTTTLSTLTHRCCLLQSLVVDLYV